MEFNENSSDGSRAVGTATPTGQVDRRTDKWIDRCDGAALQTRLII